MPETSLFLPLLTSFTKYLSAVFTVWKDEVGIGRLFEAAGIPLSWGFLENVGKKLDDAAGGVPLLTRVGASWSRI